METSDKSMLMCDQSESTSGREAILDYELSWVLRMAAENNYNTKLMHQCRHILLTLIDEKDPNVKIVKVHTWKQWERVDIIADIYLERNGEKELHVLLLEDKAYTQMSEHQRDDYPTIVRKAYDSYERYSEYQGNNKYKLHCILITCFEDGTPEYDKLSSFIACNKKDNWKIFSLDNLPDKKYNNGLTESDLFNEFWIKSW